MIACQVPIPYSLSTISMGALGENPFAEATEEEVFQEEVQQAERFRGEETSGVDNVVEPNLEEHIPESFLQSKVLCPLSPEDAQPTEELQEEVFHEDVHPE
ncbi:hypothetical protein Pyn_37595 [Prunus yedoensis var. nudiflora]|uniref:Uncharacterized protein n=1 Tax=Prunus yedoensis var. nudiflora TaxID=2094558 RepID=A0A314XTE6_PRUYE|nr:hypothetical protein Pyn_37595 [Prunus yedoensis var. nudiflora]